MNQFKSAINKEMNYTSTENGALTYKSTLNACLDFFGRGGALRSNTEDEIWTLFEKAYLEDPHLAIKILFYFRDIRGGQGERRTFRIILNRLCRNYFSIAKHNWLELIPEYGRWDDFFCLIDTNFEPFIIEFLQKQLAIDQYAERPSLLAKWLPSINTTSKDQVALAKRLYKKLGFATEKDYRKMLSTLRQKIKIVESQMVKQQWAEIKYDALPSNASKKYIKAFKKHDKDRYGQFIADATEGKVKIHAATLYPYDLVRSLNQSNDAERTAIWKNLPDYTGKGELGIVMADTSGSMAGDPLNVSLSLAIYFAERNKGPFQDVFMTFSERPTWHSLKGKTLYEKITNLDDGGWDGNTNLQAAFELILLTALRNKVPKDDMPKKLYIVSDMEFDEANNYNYDRYSLYPKFAQKLTNFEAIKLKYQAAGYDLPTIVFWNVNARNAQSPITINDLGVYLVSGCSPSIFKHIMASKTINAVNMMLEVLNSERYKKIDTYF